ncbi:MAG: Nif3-like dinuclear metal center hexameric protein [Cocleimonas sp.]|nr:Nif3-like dinuclear metal center hexameric protein [Cocleimonas sp.]
MSSLNRLVDYTNDLLSVDKFKDYAPNGLQVEGKHEIHRLLSGVTATMDLIDAAIEHKADVLLVHHGWFWNKENPCVVGMKKKRLQKLMCHDISLLAYHLPLDAHTTLGNNAQLAELFGFTTEGVMDSQGIGNYGRLREYMSLEGFGEKIEKGLNRKPLLISGGDHAIRRIAWCSGGAQDWIHQAIELGVDAFISGEISESTVHVAKESGIHYIAAGHHATERYGVKTLGDHLAAKHGLEHTFIDIDNPV